MKVGNIIDGFEVVDVKRVNKLNLIQFLKEVDNYLQKGYKIDVNSARQVGLVLQADVYKTDGDFAPKVGSTEEVKTDAVKTVESPEVDQETEAAVQGSVVPETTGQQEQVSAESTKSVEDKVKEEVPVAPKKTTTRSKKTAQ